MKRISGQWAGFAVLLFAAGCGGGPQFAEVEGTVSKGGTPLNNVRVEFWPDGDGPKSTAVTDEQGRFTLKTEDGKTAGAMVGAHKVVLKDLNMFGDTFLGRKAENMTTLNKNAKERFSKVYADPSRTDLKQTVGAGQKNVLSLEVK